MKISGIDSIEEGVIGFADELFLVSASSPVVITAVERILSQHGPVSVEWNTRENTAIAGEDYVESDGTVEFADGERIQHIEIPILTRQNVSEHDRKDFIVELGNCEGPAVVGQYEATVAITHGKHDGYNKLILHGIHTYIHDTSSLQTAYKSVS